MMKPLTIDMNYMTGALQQMLDIPSPSGFTDQIVHWTGEALSDLGIEFELTRRGAIRADLPGKFTSPDRAIVAHLDTLGAMVKALKSNGRLELVPIGTWSSRFAEGARVTVFTDEHAHRGTILPLKASGHTFNKEIDSQPVEWAQVELRIDELVSRHEDLVRLGINVGDYVAVDPRPEFTPAGFVVARHLDNKAGAATILAAAKALVESGETLPVDCHLLFTITEEIGSGASAVLHKDVAELLSVDNGTVAPGQNSSERGITVAMKDSSGPFDYHLTHKILKLCAEHGLPHERDVFRYYYCDATSALEAGNDIRTALVCFGLDASHGHERVHLDSLKHLAELLTLYARSAPTFARDAEKLGNLEGFPTQITDNMREELDPDANTVTPMAMAEQER